MNKKFALALLLLPCLVFAADPEIEQLKEELRALSTLYQSKISEVETRLAAIEAREKTMESKVSLVQDNIAVVQSSHEDYDFTPGFDPERFQYYGYMRSGYGVNDDGTSQERFQLPGAGAAYRLGNEKDTYMEMGFSYYSLNQNDDPTGPVFGTHIMLGYATEEKNTEVGVGNNGGGNVAIREAYVSAKNVIPDQAGATLWGGQRYYRRHDVHLNDFYWLDMSGYGGGIEDYDLGFAKASLAWIGGTVDDFSGTDDYIGDLETTDKNNIDLRLNDIDLGIGKGNLWFDYSHYKLDSEFENGSADGYAVGFWLDSEVTEKLTNIAVVQYGSGVAANFNSFSPSLRTSDTGEIPAGTDVDDQSRLRIMDTFLYQYSERLSMQAFAQYQKEDLGLDRDTDVTWYSVGVRPVYDFTDLYNLAIEVGYDYTKTETDLEGGLFKFTVAPGITPDFGLFTRPTIRLFFTYAQWSDDFKGDIGGDAYKNDTSGITYGVQVESWW